MSPFRTIFSGTIWWKYALAVLTGISIPVATSVGGDMLWLHGHHAEAPALMQQYRSDSRQLAVTDVKVDVLQQEVAQLVNSIQKLTDAITQERIERAREKRR
jgi:hypothetical protein